MDLVDENGETWELEEKSARPQPKVAAAAVIGTPLAVVLIWYLGLLEIDMPAEVAAAISALVASVVAYFKKD